MTTFATIQHASYTEADWTAWDGILKEGQIAFSTDLLYTATNQMRYKVGNGTDTWTALDYVPEGGGSGTSFPIATAGGTVDAITATYTPALTLTDKVLCAVVVSGANTSTTPTFAPDGLTAHTITKDGGQPLIAGDIPGALSVIILEYNLANTRWELVDAQTDTLVQAGGLINSATSKATPVDADYIGLMDSAASNILKKLSWANIKATLKTYFDTLYATLSVIPYVEIMTGSNATFSPLDSTTTYTSASTALTPNATATNRQFKLPIGTLKSVWLYVDPITTVGSNEDVTYYLRNITTATSTILGTLKYDVRGNAKLITGLSISVNATDFYSVEIANPAFATNPVNCYATAKLIIYP